MKSHFATIVAGVLTTSGAASAATVHLDMSNSMTYDAVGTQVEMDRLLALPADQLPEANKRTLLHTIGQHGMLNNGGNNGRAYYSGNQGDGGLPSNGLTGFIGDRDYRFETFDNGTGDATSSNALVISARNNSVSNTWTLDASEQQRYDDINFLFVGSRSNTAGSYQARITANYTDGSSTDIYDTGLVAVGSGEAGGSFGSGGVGSQGGLYQSSDSDTNVALAIGMTTAIDHTGPWSTNPTSRVNTNLIGSMWRFATPLDLDETKTLESVTFYASSSGSGRNVAYFFAASATAVPEPTSVMLFAAAATGLGMARRASN